MKLRMGRSVTVSDLTPTSVSWQSSMALRLPIPAFPGQDMQFFMRGLQSASLGIGQGIAVAPPLELKLFTVPDGTFFVGGGLDGAILTDGHRPVLETTVFSSAHKAGRLEDTEIDLPEPTQLDEVFVGFDGAWTNYFHWICFAIPKSFLAAQQFDPGVVIALPDYRRALDNGGISYTETTWRQSLALSGLSERVTPLPKGVYRARKLRFFWTAPGKPTDIMYSSAFKEVFDTMSIHHTRTSVDLDNIFVVRSDRVHRRVGAEVEEMLARVVAQHGFTTVQLEDLDLSAQIAMFANAKRVVAAHGSGLANMLFHRGGLKVLELNCDLDGNHTFRPWFYVTAAIRKHRYVMLDATMPDLSHAHVEAALAVLNA